MRRFDLLVAALLACSCARTPAREQAPSPPTFVVDASAPLARASDESNVAVLGARLLVARGQIHDVEALRLEAELAAAYNRMRADEDDPASSLRFSTRPLGDGDVLLYEPAPGRSRAAVVFLHGYGGRFALPCWQIASAVVSRGFSVACPSIGAAGDWWTREGERVVRETKTLLEREGFDHFVLAGLSNGAIGASRLAPRLRGSFTALVLVSGADPSADPPGVPALVVHGKRDTMTSPHHARAYAVKSKARYVDVDAGHFALLLLHDEIERAIGDFLGVQGASELR